MNCTLPVLPVAVCTLTPAGKGLRATLLFTSAWVWHNWGLDDGVSAANLPQTFAARLQGKLAFLWVCSAPFKKGGLASSFLLNRNQFQLTVHDPRKHVTYQDMPRADSILLGLFF